MRILCLGNELMADDAFGIAVARELSRRRPELDVIASSASGLALLDSVIGAARLLVVDTIESGAMVPGTVSILRREGRAARGKSTRRRAQRACGPGIRAREGVMPTFAGDWGNVLTHPQAKRLRVAAAQNRLRRCRSSTMSRHRLRRSALHPAPRRSQRDTSYFHHGLLETIPGGSPHYIGLFETLRLGRALGLDVPEVEAIIAVEPADCLTVGGEMHDSVRRAIPRAVALAEEYADQP